MKVTFNFAGSSALATQINQGAPADVFASAAPTNMKTVTDAGNVGPYVDVSLLGLVWTFSGKRALTIDAFDPDRGIKNTVVRTTLENLVARGQAQRTKQGSSVYYIAPDTRRPTPSSPTDSQQQEEAQPEEAQ